MKGYDAACHKRAPGLADLQDTVQDYVSALLDPDNDPTAVFPFAVDSLLELWHARVGEEEEWRAQDANRALEQALREAHTERP